MDRPRPGVCSCAQQLLDSHQSGDARTKRVGHGVPKACLDSGMILSKNMASPSLPEPYPAEMDSIHPP